MELKIYRKYVEWFISNLIILYVSPPHTSVSSVTSLFFPHITPATSLLRDCVNKHIAHFVILQMHTSNALFSVVKCQNLSHLQVCILVYYHAHTSANLWTFIMFDILDHKIKQPIFNMGCTEQSDFFWKVLLCLFKPSGISLFIWHIIV